MSDTEKKRILILGGGLTALAAADKLLPDYDVTILEKHSQLGGLAGSFEHDFGTNEQPNKKKIPLYYHHVIAHNTITQKYLNRYNLLDGAEWKNINVVIGVNNKISNITKIPGLLKFNFLNLWEKIRFGLFGLYTIFLMDPSKIPEEMDAQTWLTKYAGKAVTDKVFYNLYGRNKFNTTLDIVSAKQFAYRLKEREVYDKFTFPPKGLQMLIDSMKEEIIKKGGLFVKNANISAIDLDKKEVIANKQNYKADIIISTIPIPYMLPITIGLPQDYTQQLSKIRYCPCVSFTFGTDQFLSENNYWINLFQEPVHVIMQHSVLFDRYPDKVSWVLRYGGSEEDLEKDEEEVKQKYFAVIKRYFPHVTVKWAKLFREKYAEPVYDKDYSSYRPDYLTPIDDFYLAGIQITHPKIRNMNTALESGEIVADLVKNNTK